MPRRSWPPQLVPERSDKENIKRMVKKKIGGRRKGLEFDSHQKHPHEHLLAKRRNTTIYYLRESNFSFFKIKDQLCERTRVNSSGHVVDRSVSQFLSVI